jgi:hypothetical protein
MGHTPHFDVKCVIAAKKNAPMKYEMRRLLGKDSNNFFIFIFLGLYQNEDPLIFSQEREAPLVKVDGGRKHDLIFDAIAM